jgi:transposase
MDRAALAPASRAELIELVVGLGALVADQQATIARLEAEVAELRRPPKTPDTSSLPPSHGRKPNRAERPGRKRGPKRGHAGISHRRQRPDVVVQCRPAHCGGCGAPLPRPGQRRVGRSQVIEVAPARAVVVEAWRYAARCSACGRRTVAPVPAGLEAERTFGPGVEVLLGYLHERHHLSYERLAEVCRDLWGLRISQGAIAHALARLAERARPAAEAIGAQVRASPTIGSDETGARVDGRTRWQWVFQTPTASYHTIVPSRGAGVIDAFLGGAAPAAWVSDLWSAQVGTPAQQHQVCLAHQLRDLSYAAEADDRPGRLWAVALRRVFARAIRLHGERPSIAPASFEWRRVRIVNAAERLVFGPPLGRGEAWALQQRYRRHFPDLFVCLERDGVEPTNNASERDLRNSVIHRKVTGGHRSDWGAEASAVVTSILTTARKRGENLYRALRDLAGPSPLDAAGMAT